jgi:hypothetical protein
MTQSSTFPPEIRRASRLLWELIASDAPGALAARDRAKAEFLGIASQIGEGFAEMVAAHAAKQFCEKLTTVSLVEAERAMIFDIKRLIKPYEYYTAVTKPRGCA